MTDPTSPQPGLNMTALSPPALTPPYPPAVTASSLPDTGALSHISTLDVETCAISDPDSSTGSDIDSDDDEKVKNARMRIAREQFIRANHNPVSYKEPRMSKVWHAEFQCILILRLIPRCKTLWKVY